MDVLHAAQESEGDLSAGQQSQLARNTQNAQKVAEEMRALEEQVRLLSPATQISSRSADGREPRGVAVCGFCVRCAVAGAGRSTSCGRLRRGREGRRHRRRSASAAEVGGTQTPTVTRMTGATRQRTPSALRREHGKARVPRADL
jgi:hypothetical protein